MSNRHVPIIIGVIAIVIAFYLVGAFSGWWRYLFGTLFFSFGCVSLKTALFASNQEVKELTGDAPLSVDTSAKLKGRI